MSLAFFAAGLSLAGLLGLGRGSVRRYLVAAALGILVASPAFPLVGAVGYLSREALEPTLAALLPAYPLLALVPLAAALALALAHFGGRVAGLGGLLGGGLGLFALLSFLDGHAHLVKLRPVPGLMEGVAALALAIPFLALAWGQRKRAWLWLPLGVALGFGAFSWLNSPTGHTYFPRMGAYYKLVLPAEPGAEEALVQAFNQGLEELNRVRQEIGLPPLKPIQDLSGLGEGRLPQEVAQAGYRLLQPAALRYGAVALLLFLGVLFGAGLWLVFRPGLEDPGDLRQGGVMAAVALSIFPAFDATEFDLGKLVKGWPFLVNFLDRAWPPNLAQPQQDIYPLQSVASEMLLTVEIALVGTLLAALFALPTSFLAARNLTFKNPVLRLLFYLMRGFYNVDRGVDTLILALILVAAVGLGPFAGVLAMAIHSIADLGKLYSEAIENVDKGPIEALESVGASGSNVLRWAILPQVLPLFVSYTLYRFEINFRVSIVLGLVGAGGIGFFIKGAMDAGHYDQMVIGIIAIVLVVNLIDFASSWLRSRLV
ncbi:phosphonate ABC transporter, permease protein PhnE [Thermus thalpophilus]|uniref:phosphonate ABC transporter, permease protein PhnE n=1 Tax=Thermus thalpophilus TaxID=2908147 RepID=UPI001FAAD143|nr:phosphonate ABC transporter, permease protein PhnE [Thermus thalpophilus]